MIIVLYNVQKKSKVVPNVIEMEYVFNAQIIIIMEQIAMLFVINVPGVLAILMENVLIKIQIAKIMQLKELNAKQYALREVIFIVNIVTG